LRFLASRRAAAAASFAAALMGWLRAQGNLSGALFGSDMCDVGLLALNGFRVAAGLEQAAALAMAAGLDQELCNPTDGRGQAFPLAARAVADGLMPQAALDRAAANALRAKFAAGLFDGRAIVNGSDLAQLDSPANRALARQVALEGMVLLKADAGVLPLRLGGGTSAAAADADVFASAPVPPLRVAIIGPLAGCAGNASSCDATLSQTGGYTNNGVQVVSVLAAAYNESGVSVSYAPGAGVGGNDTSGFANAVALARAADIVLFVGGDSGGLGWNLNTCGEDDDRSELDLPGVQSDLVAALADTGVPVVLALIHGRPVTFVRNNLLARVAAVVAMWRPGEEGGAALWDLLSGRAAPSGRLAQAWVRSVGQVKSQASPWFSLLQGDFDRVDYNGDKIASRADPDSPFVSWTPGFVFGFGLSYTTFSLELLNATVTGAGAAASATTFVRVTNTGAAAAKQVVQVYYSMPISALVRYHLRLLAFAKTDVLAPQQAVTLAITAPAEAFASYDPALGALTVEAGAYTISVGASSADISGTASITLAAATIGKPAPAAVPPEKWLEERAELVERAKRAELFKDMVMRGHRVVHDEVDMAMTKLSSA
jgi:beta-xylosidase